MKGTKIKHYLYRIRTLPPGKVVRVVLNRFGDKIAGHWDRFWVRLKESEISNQRLIEAMVKTRVRLERREDLLDYFRKREEPRCFIDFRKKEEIVAVLRTDYPEVARNIVLQADRICDGIFNIMGGGSKRLEPIDWHLDFKSGYRWNPRTYYKDIKYPVEVWQGADIKIPWEISRFNYLSQLGQAYWLTGDEKYAEKFVSLLSDWIIKNPVKQGLNWNSTIEAGIRVANWILGWYFFKDSEAITPEFVAEFIKSLLIHGRFIRSNLEYTEGLTSNHYISNIVGLFYLGIFLPEFREGEEWLSFSKQELEKEMQKQVYSDGMDFEASTCYHRFVLELFFYPALLARLNEIDFSLDYLSRLKKMFDFILYALKPNGKMVQMGDNDSGRLYKFEAGEKEVVDMRYLLNLGAIFFDEQKYKIREFGFCSGVLWIFGPETLKRRHEMPDKTIADLQSKSFSEAGIYIMREGNNYLIISSGPNGQNGNGGHSHNDKLSFEAFINGEEVFIDPGTYVYTSYPEWRDKFRSTGFHNTVMIDEKEQNRFLTLFSMVEEAKPKVIKWEINDNFDVFVGEQYGYTRLLDKLIHRRTVKFHKKEVRWEFQDNVYNLDNRFQREHRVQWSLILHPDIEIEDANTLKTKNDKKIKIICENGTAVHPEDAWYSPEYGVKVPTKKLVWEIITDKPISFRWMVEYGKHGKED
ncbi:MAG: alginate lyase family protein [bacterium]